MFVCCMVRRLSLIHISDERSRQVAYEQFLLLRAEVGRHIDGIQITADAMADLEDVYKRQEQWRPPAYVVLVFTMTLFYTRRRTMQHTNIESPLSLW